MVIALIAILIAGVANFAMHRWMLESGHPAVEAATGAMRRTLGRHSTYVIEFILLLTAALVVGLVSWTRVRDTKVRAGLLGARVGGGGARGVGWV